MAVAAGAGGPSTRATVPARLIVVQIMPFSPRKAGSSETARGAVAASKKRKEPLLPSKQTWVLCSTQPQTSTPSRKPKPNTAALPMPAASTCWHCVKCVILRTLIWSGSDRQVGITSCAGAWSSSDAESPLEPPELLEPPEPSELLELPEPPPSPGWLLPGVSSSVGSSVVVSSGGGGSSGGGSSSDAS